MRVLISPNAFKGTLSAMEAAELVDSVLKKSSLEIDSRLVPIADGGDGTCQLLNDALGFEKVTTWILDAYGRPIEGFYGWDLVTKTAYIDVSTASGLGVLAQETKNPFVASSFGTGILIRKAVEDGAKEIVLGLGGSATIDLGIGVLAALGISFLDEKGRQIPMFSPEYLNSIKYIQRPPKLPDVRFTFLCDVRNTFLGTKGAIPIFGEQKGLKNQFFGLYQENCVRLIDLLFSKVKLDFEDREGFGAAGGIALGISAFFGTQIEFGSNYFFEKVNLSEHVKWSDLVITGEGKYDAQSNEGKACFELLQLTKKYQKKSILISSGNEALNSGFDQVLILPDLDFYVGDFKIKARENFLRLLETYLNL
jgi:glycerate kinase